ncbi:MULTISPECIES: cytochrome c [unclassified Bradyrhizobium]|uniref:c-type cytochrome n=1 Tax=unclassified Bradyrhizobium TaxID=2631580 RepID=UPI002479742A|nr:MULTISPECIES: cytochrome c [unclassified Bradyrhizobium]WGR72675.1 cytochrome c [Bradyrhizobium sp. ISRA426]WGR77508.1 cytochrome c [Bradyrhizobium sp. ISRA430]WGR87914.1 cytochrome c [Bradyrhizobium sp. ISRA432]
MSRVLLIVALATLLAACDQNMDVQPSYSEYSSAPSFRGSVLRRPPANTVARDDLEREKVATAKPALSAQLLARGRQRFSIFCSPCHGAGGDGTGIIVQRGMPRPTSYHNDRLLAADDQYFFDVITNGHGAMYSYAARVQPADRWAIVAYIRALQLSRHASLDDVPSDERAKLESSP